MRDLFVPIGLSAAGLIGSTLSIPGAEICYLASSAVFVWQALDQEPTTNHAAPSAPTGMTVLRARIDEVIAAHEAGALHFEIADTFRAEGYSVSGVDVRDVIRAYREVKAEDALRQDEQGRVARATVALTDLSAALRQTAS